MNQTSEVPVFDIHISVVLSDEAEHGEMHKVALYPDDPKPSLMSVLGALDLARETVLDIYGAR